jgi:N-methylhydantoinase B/oxoprolinase/acetone carboxylase alpha subunit
LFGTFITNKMKRLGNAHIIGCITTKIPTWDYHQLIVYAYSRVHVIVVGGGNKG